MQWNECDNILKAKDEATTELLKRFRTIHSIDVMKQKTQKKTAAEISKFGKWCSKPKKPIESTQKMMSELAAVKKNVFPNDH